MKEALSSNLVLNEYIYWCTLIFITDYFLCHPNTAPFLRYQNVSHIKIDGIIPAIKTQYLVVWKTIKLIYFYNVILFSPIKTTWDNILDFIVFSEVTSWIKWCPNVYLYNPDYDILLSHCKVLYNPSHREMLVNTLSVSSVCHWNMLPNIGSKRSIPAIGRQLDMKQASIEGYEYHHSWHFSHHFIND